MFLSDHCCIGTRWPSGQYFKGNWDQGKYRVPFEFNDVKYKVDPTQNKVYDSAGACVGRLIGAGRTVQVLFVESNKENTVQ